MTENTLKCSSCGHEVGGWDNFCPSCGRAASAAPDSGKEGNPYLLLMTANVLRLRHQWDLAEAKCSEVLRLDPNNAAACSVMGDLLRDQGREEDAIEWYKMALDRDPAGEADRKKLEALIDHRFSPQPASRPNPSLSAVTKWAKSARDEVRAARPICPWAMVTAAIFAITLLAAFSLVLLGKRTTPPPGSVGEGAVLVNDSPRVPSAPTPPVSAAPAEITGDISALEAGILDQLQRRATELNPNCQVSLVRVDPKAATADVEMSMPAYWSPASARKEIARMAAAVAIACAQSDDRLVYVHLRTSTRPPTGPDQLVMVGSGTADELRRHSESTTPGAPESAFSTVWWSPEIAPESEAAASSLPFTGGRGTTPGGQ